MGYKSVIRGKHLFLPPHKLMKGLLWMRNTNKGITTVWATIVAPYVASIKLSKRLKESPMARGSWHRLDVYGCHYW